LFILQKYYYNLRYDNIWFSFNNTLKLTTKLTLMCMLMLKRNRKICALYDVIYIYHQTWKIFYKKLIQIRIVFYDKIKLMEILSKKIHFYIEKKFQY